MLAPTKPLCDQHADTFRKHLEIPPEKVVVFTGSNSGKAGELWKEGQIFISTPQGLENDVINQRIHLPEISLLILTRRIMLPESMLMSGWLNSMKSKPNFLEFWL